MAEDVQRLLRLLGEDIEKSTTGLQTLRAVGGEEFAGPVSALAEVSEDLARMTIEFGYGEVLARPGLSLRERQILTSAMLLAHGSAQAQLRFHLAGLLNVGGSASDVVGLLYIAAAVLGFPAAIDALPIVRELFSERGLPVALAGNHDRYSTGGVGDPDARVELERVSRNFVEWERDVARGELLARSGFDSRLLHMAMAAMVASASRYPAILAAHFREAMNSGASKGDLEELVIQLSVYAGFPSALSAATVLKAVLENSKVSSPAAMAPGAGNRDERFRRGSETLAATSANSGAQVVESFKDVAPELGRLLVEHCYGDIFCRSDLDPKVRELTACAALAASATAVTARPLAVHINAALNLGAARDEIVGTLLNVIPYAGYPAVEKALLIALKCFEEWSGRKV